MKVKKAFAIILLLAFIGVCVMAWMSKKTEPTPAPISAVFTNVVISNNSQNEDSVKVYVTIQAPNSVVGLFGIQAQDTIGSCSKGFFYAVKGNTYESNDTSTLLGVVVAFGGDNWPCKQAIANGFYTGINVFECSINTAYETFDIGCEDGVNSILNASVSDTINWATGDGNFIQNFRSAQNTFPILNNIDIRGVFPYRCTNCRDMVAPIPDNCFNLKDSCSKEKTCLVSRTNNIGGTIYVKYLGKAWMPAK